MSQENARRSASTDPPAAGSALVIGVGPSIRYHRDSLLTLPAFDTVGVYARDSAAASIGAGDRARAYFGSLRGAISHSGPNATVFADHTRTNVSLVTELLQAGVHVMIQASCADDAADLRSLAHAAATFDASFAVSLVHRHADEIVAFKSMLDRGRLGAIRMVRVRSNGRLPGWHESTRQQTGDIVLQSLDLIQHLFGPVRAIESVVPWGSGGGSAQSEDLAVAVYRLETSAIVIHEFDVPRVGDPPIFEVDISGSDASARLVLPSAITVIAKNGRSVDYRFADQASGLRHHQLWLSGRLDTSVDAARTAIELTRDVLSGLALVA